MSFKSHLCPYLPSLIYDRGQHCRHHDPHDDPPAEEEGQDDDGHHEAVPDRARVERGVVHGVGQAVDGLYGIVTRSNPIINILQFRYDLI